MSDFTKRRLQKLAGLLKEQNQEDSLFDAEDLFGDIEDVPEKNPARQTVEDLDSGDKFTIGNRKPVYRVIGPPGKDKGAMLKPVVIDGSAERKYYMLKVVDTDTFDVGAFEAIGGGSDTIDKPHRGRTGPVVPITDLSEGRTLANAADLPNIGPPTEPQQDVMPKVQVLEELRAVLGEVLAETADEAWYQGAKFLADALTARIEGL